MFTIPVGFNKSVAAAAASLITSKETFSITVANGASSNTATITSVDKSLSLATLNWTRGAITVDDLNDNYFNVVLTDATTVTATRSATTGASDMITIGEVLTFDSTFVKEVHHGTVTTSGTSTASSSFNATKANCAVVFLGVSTPDTADSYDRSHPTLSITGVDTAVTVTATKTDGATNIIVSFAIIEFQTSAITSINEEKMDMIATELTATATITAVTAANTMCLWGGWQSDQIGAVYDSAACSVKLDSTTQVSVTRGASTGACSGVVTVVEFSSSVFTSIERLQTTMGSGETTTDVTLGTTLTDTDTAFINYLGFNLLDASQDVNPAQQFATIEILSTTTIRIIRNTARDNALTVSYEVVQPS